MSPNVAIFTDSTADLPQEIVAKRNIIVVPQTIVWGSEELKDGIDITPQEFYERLQRDPVHPSTAQPTAYDFVETFRQAKKNGAEGGVAIVLSQEMSGTYHSALNAVQEIGDEFPSLALDSRTVSMGLGLVVLAGADARDAGGSPEDIYEAAKRVSERMNVLFVVDTLEYLHRGGRIGGAAKLVGTALNLKPLLEVRDGRIEPLARIRAKKRAVARMLDEMEKRVEPGKRLIAAVLHGNVPDEAEALADEVRQRFSPDDLLVSLIGPTVGVHVGPGVLGVCFYHPD